MVTSKQAAANRRNAQRSTGPRSAKGKATASANAMTHGVLSAHLLLPDEDENDWRQLLEGLLDELKPVGLLEQTLVERIAVAIWRQRRIVRAETARIKMAQKPDGMLRKRVEDTLGPGFQKTVGNILLGIGEDNDVALIEEFAGALSENVVTLSQLQANFPLAWAHLNAEAAEIGIDDFLQKVYQGKLRPYFQARVKHLAKILNLREDVATTKSANSLPVAPELMTRYQSALDNDLYKAMRALREAQRFRRESIDGEANEVAPE